MKRRPCSRHKRRGPSWTVVFRRSALGRLEVTLPAEACVGLGPVGARVWFAVRRGSVEVSAKPRGPRPSIGRRSTRTRRPRGRPNGSRYVRRR